MEKQGQVEISEKKQESQTTNQAQTDNNNTEKKETEKSNITEMTNTEGNDNEEETHFDPDLDFDFPVVFREVTPAVTISSPSFDHHGSLDDKTTFKWSQEAEEKGDDEDNFDDDDDGFDDNNHVNIDNPGAFGYQLLNEDEDNDDGGLNHFGEEDQPQNKNNNELSLETPLPKEHVESVKDIMKGLKLSSAIPEWVMKDDWMDPLNHQGNKSLPDKQQ